MQFAPSERSAPPQLLAGVVVGADGLPLMVALTEVLPDSQPAEVLQET